MDIGTAKPSEVERESIPHHLFDVVEPDRQFTVAEYKQQAGEKIEELFAREIVPIVCGGTGLYARALLEGLDIPPVAPQPDLRASLTAYAEENGNQSLHDKLREIDPIAADRLNFNDRFRVIRAIEVTSVLGRPFSSISAKSEPPYETVWIGLTVEDRSLLRKDLETRMQAQLAAGLIDEVQGLVAKYGCTRAITNAVNYKEFIDHIRGSRSLKDSIDECITHSYQLARRQIMWFKTNTAINWFSVDRLSREELFARVQAVLTAKNLTL